MSCRRGWGEAGGCVSECARSRLAHTFNCHPVTHSRWIRLFLFFLSPVSKNALEIFIFFVFFACLLHDGCRGSCCAVGRQQEGGGVSKVASRRSSKHCCDTCEFLRLRSRSLSLLCPALFRLIRHFLCFDLLRLRPSAALAAGRRAAPLQTMENFEFCTDSTRKRDGRTYMRACVGMPHEVY